MRLDVTKWRRIPYKNFNGLEKSLRPYNILLISINHYEEILFLHFPWEGIAQNALLTSRHCPEVVTSKIYITKLTKHDVASNKSSVSVTLFVFSIKGNLQVTAVRFVCLHVNGIAQSG